MLKVETWPIERLVPYCRNPRRNDEHVDRMVSAIKEFGFRIPIVAKSDGSVVDGHLRLKAAQKLGLTEVPVALADELSEAQVKAFRLLANKSANWAAWDDELLKLELEDLQAMSYDVELAGFEAAEIDELFEAQENEEGQNEEGQDDKYTNKVATPIYEPTGADVSLSDLADTTRLDALMKKISESGVSDAEKMFLKNAATRHIAFNYQNIAEYYASKASPEMQALMEESALVIIDIDKAIENGFVEFSKHIKEIMRSSDDAS